MNRRTMRLDSIPVMLALIICYRLLLDSAYFKVMAIQYAYEGLKDHRTMGLMLLSWITLLGFCIPFTLLIRNQRDDRVSSIIIQLLFLLSFVPFTTCIYSGILANGYIIYNVGYWALLLLFQIIIGKKTIKPLPKVKIGDSVFGDKAVMFLGFLSLFIVLYISGKYTHFRLNFNLYGVYNLRNEVSTYNIPTILSYVFAWTRAINPVLLAYCLLKRKRVLSVVFFCSQMLSFGIDGLKTTFFIPFLVIAAVIFYGRIKTHKLKIYILIAFVSVMVAGLLEKLLLHTNFIYELFTRRIMFLTNYIGNCYYDFFSHNSPDYFRESFFRFFGLKSQYASAGGVSLTIGATYYRSGVNFNNGLASDALANLGSFGWIIMPIMVVLVLRLFDRSVSGLDKRLVISTALYFSIVFLSSFLTTILLTHGVLVLVVILSMINREQFEEKI